MALFLKDLVSDFKLELVTLSLCLEEQIRDVYIGDLLSWVMSKATEGCAWITIQGHINIVAVAHLVGVSCIIVAENAEVSVDTIEKANKEEIAIFKTSMTAYHLSEKFIEAGV